MKRVDWDRRIRRAIDLGERDSSISEVLTFYKDILRVEQQIYSELGAHSKAADTRSGSALREQIEVDLALQWLPIVLELARRKGPAKLAQEAQRLSSAARGDQRQILSDFLHCGQAAAEDAGCFFARFVLQPYAEFLAAQSAVTGKFFPSTCPICGGKPQLAILRPEGDGGKRHLACSFCLTEWEFRRVLCPVCGEVEHTKLPRYSPDDPIAVRVEACDTCKFYLKSFDMTVDGLMVPEVDEVATIALDLWAAEHGYRKIYPNLMGF